MGNKYCLKLSQPFDLDHLDHCTVELLDYSSTVQVNKKKKNSAIISRTRQS